MDLLDFSDEIIEQIFLTQRISHQDLGNICQACKRLNEIASSNELWKVKLYNRWPTQWVSIPKESFRDVYKERSANDAMIMIELRKIMRGSFHLRSIPHKLMKEISRVSVSERSFIIDGLLAIINNADLKYLRMDLVYYARKVYDYVRCQKATSNLMNCVTRDGFHDLFEGIKFLAIGLEVDYLDNIHQIEDLKNMFDEKVLGTKEYEYPSMSTQEDIKRILWMFNDFLLKDGTFAQKAFLLMSDTDRKFSSSALKCCFYITLARKLGLDVNAVRIDDTSARKSQFFTSIKPSIGDTIYIEFRSGMLKMVDEQSNLLARLKATENATKKDIFVCLLHDVIEFYKHGGQISGRQIQKIQWLIETLLQLSPTEDESRLFLTRIYLHQNSNIDETLEHLTYLISHGNLPSEPIHQLLTVTKRLEEEKKNEEKTQPKLRSSTEDNQKVVYKIGMIMRHRRLGYMCVIYGWDNFCDMPYNWQRQMGVLDMLNGPNQPFYNVMVNDGSNRYAAQESLMMHANPGEIAHEEIGKYFCSIINSCYYKPTEMLNEMYPEDCDWFGCPDV
ncbi:F-box only protein 21-like [Clytia hemisphaerica]|uniref:Ig-like domain-containing protein n=1 Tax=Clytia hemisphaerica TaxID=252671 RepID=A0A7M5U6N0_9CNID|eukprot:TCONS_00064714-protein